MGEGGRRESGGGVGGRGEKREGWGEGERKMDICGVVMEGVCMRMVRREGRKEKGGKWS